MQTVAQITTSDNRYYATYCDLEGMATILEDGRVLFAAEGAHNEQGMLTLAAHDPDLVLAGHCATADAQRAADCPTHPWHAAVQAVAARAKAALGEASSSRIDKAVQIVLAGGVHLNEDCSAVVESQSEPLKGYRVNGVCPCPDFARAPSALCKHRIAAYIQRRALELAQPPSEEAPPTYTPQEVALVAQEACLLPEAPCSVNTFVEVKGYRVQVTLRGVDEQAVMARLEALLDKYAY